VIMAEKKRITCHKSSLLYSTIFVARSGAPQTLDMRLSVVAGIVHTNRIKLTVTNKIH